MSMQSTPDVVAVSTQSAWASKINWTQAISGGAAALVFLTGGKVNIPPDVQLAIVTGIGVAGTVVTWIMRTWFSKTVTPASVANATTTTIPVQSALPHIS